VILTVGLLILGLVLLVGGAEALVRASSLLARKAGISPLVVGLTVVAYGTSTPEIAVSLKGALSGQSDIALGNVVGSNIFNVLFILGASALITPLVVSQQLIRKDVPIMIGISLGTILFCLDGTVNRWEGGILLLGVIFYTVFLIKGSRLENNSEVKAEYEKEYSEGKSSGSIFLQILWILAGLCLLVLGARYFVQSAVDIARALGLSELVIALTILAVGTSLPEVATSIMASIRNERDIAVGNVIGSNIYNLLAVLGISAVFAPKGIQVSPAALSFDLPVMLAVSIACLPIFFTGSRINRWEGGLFLGYYVAYTAYLIMLSTQHDQLPFFSRTMSLFVIPITVATLLVYAYRHYNYLKKEAVK
jgi:cation:H+ antiporter